MPADPKCSTLPPGYTPPAPAPRYPARTADEVLRGLAADPFVGPLGPDGAFGAPVLIKALRSSDHDEWLVPIVRGGEVGGVVVVPIYENGMGSAGIATGWSGRFPHSLRPEQAAAKAVAPGDAAVSVELVWATVDPRQGGPANEFLPFYLVTRRSSARWYVFQSGTARESSQVDIALR
jgi:hypothetical protein